MLTGRKAIRLINSTTLGLKLRKAKGLHLLQFFMSFPRKQESTTLKSNYRKVLLNLRIIKGRRLSLAVPGLKFDQLSIWIE